MTLGYAGDVARGGLPGTGQSDDGLSLNRVCLTSGAAFATMLDTSRRLAGLPGKAF